MSTHEELRQGCHFRGKATLQLLHSYNHSTRSVTFITIMSSFHKRHFLQKFLLIFLSGLVFS